MWVTNNHGGTVSEIDASTGTVVKTIKVDTDPFGVSSDGTHVWVANQGGTVSEIDASTGRGVQTISDRGSPAGVSSDGTRVWVANNGFGTVSEIGVVSSGCVVPELTGSKLAAAKTALKQADCAVGKITKVKASGVPTGRVISSSPRAGSKHKARTRVALVVSLGRD